jgi:hypothetical protein
MHPRILGYERHPIAHNRLSTSPFISGMKEYLATLACLALYATVAAEAKILGCGVSVILFSDGLVACGLLI